MNNSFWKQAALGFLLMAGTCQLTACETKPAAQTAPAATAAPADSSRAVAAAYICPMGCEGSASDKPGKCPVCEMTLEANPAAVSTTK
jgi:hypothetical protein